MKVKKSSGKPILARARRPLEKAADTPGRRFVKALAARWRLIVGVAAGTLVVAAGIVGYFWYRNDREERAARAYARLSDAGTVRLEDAYKKAGPEGRIDEKKLTAQLIRDLENYVARYGETGPGRAASFELAGLYFEQGEYKKAKTVFARLEESGDAFEKALAAKGVGDCERALGNYKDAVAKYNALRRSCGDNFPGVPVAMALADCYRQLGDDARAKEIYRHIIENEKASPFAAEAANALAEIYAVEDAGRF